MHFHQIEYKGDRNMYQGRIEGASFTSNDVPEILSK